MSDGGDLGLPDPEDEEEKAKQRPGSDDSGWCDGCDDGCSLCDGCNLLRLSSVLVALAAAHPPTPVVLAGLAFYRRTLTRFTPRCPSTPSCSAFAVDAVERLGARRGLRAAALRLRGCRSPIG